ncbi:hypothetical protein [Hydrogenimonas sp.]
MADQMCKTNPDNGELRGSKLKRNNYFRGKRLDVEDFNAEQTYLIQKVRRLGAYLFGSGVISGLRIEKVEPAKRSLTLTAGSAVDGSGNLLVVLKNRAFNLDRTIVPGDYIYLQYTEEGTDKVPRERTEECSDDCCFDRIEEDVEIFLDKKLYDYSPAEICKSPKTGTKPQKPRVLIGRYDKGGHIDYSHVVSLHQNSELSKLLCKISEMYVRSLNGQSGDLFAVSSLNETHPDDNGHVEIEGGNNITIESEENRLKISSKSGLYARYFKTVGGKDSVVISHGFRNFPSIDIYKRVRAYINVDKKKPQYEAMTRRELYKMAKDSMMETEDLEKELEAKSFKTYMELYNEKRASAKRKTISSKSRMETARALSMYGISELSSKIHKAADVSIGRLMDDIVVIPRYYFEKVVGPQEQNLNLKITHLDTSTIRIENLSDQSVSVLVVLNA